MADESKEDGDTFLTIQECFVLHKGEKPATATGGPSSSQKHPPAQSGNGQGDRVGDYREAWDHISSRVQESLTQLHQPFYRSIAERLSSVHYDSQVAYGPPPDLPGDSTPPDLDPDALAALRPFQTLHSRLFTGLIHLGGVTPSDYSESLQGLGEFLRGGGFHVAHLSLVKGGGRGATDALRGLMKQLVGVDLETADVGVLRAWHQQTLNADKPVVVLIEEPEAADPAILEHLVLILSEWRSEVPLLLLLSVATTQASLQRLLPASTLALLRTELFLAPPTSHRLQSLVSAVLFNGDLGFSLSPRVLEWLYAQYFSGHGTLSGFLGGLHVALVQRFGSQALAPLDRFGGDKVALEKALRGWPVGGLRAAGGLSAGHPGSGKEALVARLAESLTGVWERRRDMAAAVQFLHFACQATGLTAVILPELHRWTAHPAFFADVTRHVSATSSPLALFGCFGGAGLDVASVKGQGHRLVGIATRGMKDLSSEAAAKLVQDWRGACRDDTRHLRQVRSDLLELSKALIPHEPGIGPSTPTAIRTTTQEGGPGKAERNGGVHAALRMSPRKVSGTKRTGSEADLDLQGGTQSGGGGVERPAKRPPRLVVGAAAAVQKLGTVKEKGVTETADENGGLQNGVRSSHRKITGAAQMSQKRRGMENDDRKGKGTDAETPGGGQEPALRSSPRKIVGAAGAARNGAVASEKRSPNGQAQVTGRGVGTALKRPPPRIVGAAGVVGEKRARVGEVGDVHNGGGFAAALRSTPRKGAGGGLLERGGVGEKRKSGTGRLSEDAERMQMMHRGMSAAEKRRKALSTPVVAADPGDPAKDRLGTILRRIIERFIAASQPAPLDRVSCFDDVSALSQALSPPLRGLVEHALTSTHSIMPCECCSAEGELGPSLHDTCTAYRLCAQFGDHISITSWYEAFVAAVRGSPSDSADEATEDPAPEALAEIPAPPTEREFPLQKVRGRGRPRKRPLPAEKKGGGKGKGGEEKLPAPMTEEERATLQARFFQATAELQLLGLIRPSARRPEHVQKVHC